MKVRTSVLKGFALMALSTFTLAACEDDPPISPPPALPVEVSVTPQSLTLNVGESAPLVAIVNNATNTAVTWRSASPNVATVNAQGIVTAVAPGSTVILAISQQDTTKRAAASVSVQQGGAQITLNLIPDAASVAVGQTVQMVSLVSGTTNTNVTYTSSAPAVATVSATGLVTGVAAGTAVITATSVANPNVRDASTITVTPTSTPTVTVSITPTQASVGVGGSQQFVATVQGATNTAVTWRSSDTNIATVNSNGVATGVGQGTAVITATSVADPTKSASATLTVSGASVAISAVPASPASGNFVIQTNVQVPAGTADSLMIRLIGSNGQVFQIRCQTFTAAGAATTVNCPINPADLDPNTPGAQILPNDTYTIQAVLLRQNQVAATATFGQQLATNNQTIVAGTVTFDNSRVDNDNRADNETDVSSAGLVWHGGSATVRVTPSVFSGNAVNTIRVGVDLNCDGAVEASRTATIGSNGTGEVTFSEANNLSATTPGIDNVENPMVCFVVSDARDASGAAVNLPTTGGTGNVIVSGFSGTRSNVPGATQNEFRVDNVEPTVTGTPDFNTAGEYINSSFTFSASGSSPNVTGLGAANVTDGGVGRVSYNFYAVPTSQVPAGAGQDTLRALSTTPITSASQLQSTISDNFYRLIVEAVDALGNRTFVVGDDFGVDLTAPTIAVGAGSAADNSINPAQEINITITDDFSGPRAARARITGYSVFEIDSDADVDVRCYDASTGGTVAMPTSGVCPTRDVTAALSGTTGTAQVIIPADENFYVIEITTVDVAGNPSTTTITRNALVDAEDPTATINSFTIAGTSATVNGTLRDNIELAQFDTRFEFAGLAGGGDLDELPFTTPTNVGEFGLPLTAQTNATGTTQVVVDGILSGATVYTTSRFGFGVVDAARNYNFNGITYTGTGFDGFGADFQSQTLTSSESILCRTGTTTACGTGNTGRTSTTLSAITQTSAGANNPMTQYYFYFQHPSGYWVLINSVPASAASVQTGAVRTFTVTQAMAASAFPSTGVFTVAVVAVDGDGDGVMATTTVDVR